MYIQFQAIAPGKGSFTSADFEDEKVFLDSLSKDKEFRVYYNSEKPDPNDKISVKKVLKKLKIQSVTALNKSQSYYLTFTAKDAEDASVTYEGMICWK